MVSKSPSERRLAILRLLDTQWIVYDLDENSFLCSSVEIKVYEPGVDKVYMNIPIPFTAHHYAQDVLDGKTSIGDLQHLLTNLAVGFCKDLGRQYIRHNPTELIDKAMDAHPHGGGQGRQGDGSFRF